MFILNYIFNFTKNSGFSKKFLPAPDPIRVASVFFSFFFFFFFFFLLLFTLPVIVIRLLIISPARIFFLPPPLTLPKAETARLNIKYLVK